MFANRNSPFWQQHLSADYMIVTRDLSVNFILQQNVSILDFIGAKGDGGGGNNWSYAQGVQSSSQNVTTSKTRSQFLQAGCPSCHQTNRHYQSSEGKTELLLFLFLFSNFSHLP